MNELEKLKIWVTKNSLPLTDVETFKKAVLSGGRVLRSVNGFNEALTVESSDLHINFSEFPDFFQWAEDNSINVYT